MTEKEKQQLINKLNELTKTCDPREILYLLYSEPESRSDPELAMYAVRAMLDVSELSTETDLSDSAELFLRTLGEKENTPEWHFLMARSLYLRDKYYPAYIELLRTLELNHGSDDPVPPSEVYELKEVCRAELKKLRARYSPADDKLARKHISSYFGKIVGLIKGESLTGITPHRPELDIFPDIAVIDPGPGQPWRTFVTIGSGAAPMNVPDELKPFISERCEYIMYLPEDWEPADAAWAINLMKNIAVIPKERDSYAGYGHIFSSGSPLTEDTELFGTMLISVQDAPAGAEKFTLTDGSEVTIYQLFPVYREEFEYKMTHGYNMTIDLMPHISPVFDLHRENVCRSDDEKEPVGELLLAPEFDYTGKLGVGEFCAVSRRITEQGERVGYMRRFFPDSGHPAAETDSCWLFLSGKESVRSLTAPYAIEVCRLNTVCNIDPDVLPMLDSPYNSAFVRDETGRFVPVLPDPAEPRPLMS